MKLILLISGALAICACLVFLACNWNNKLDGEATILFDRTDSMFAQPIAENILANLDLTDNKWQAIKIRTTAISAYDYNPVYTAVLQRKFFLFSNPFQRDKEVSSFGQQLNINIDSIEKYTRYSAHSSIYKCIVAEAIQLRHSQARRKSLFVFSDVQENSAFFSVYNQYNFLVLKKNPEEIQNLFLGIAKPANLNGVDIYFIYEPRSEKDNERFILMANLFKQIFTKAGALVFIEANLKVK
jgi:hypothetical protein